MKVLKTHLPKVINELLCEPTVDGVLDHMHRDLREIGVEDFGVFRFTYEGLPLEKWLLGATIEKGKLARHVRKGELQASPMYRQSELAYLGKTSPSVTWKNRLNRLESDITGWTAAFTLWENAEALKGSMARTSTSARQVSPPQDENPIAAYKTFKLHPDQKEIVEA